MVSPDFGTVESVARNAFRSKCVKFRFAGSFRLSSFGAVKHAP